MRLYIQFFFLGAVAAAPWQHWPGKPGYSSNAAAYFLDNNPSGNSLVSLKIGKDGSLSEPVKTATGGKGGISVNATGFQSTADSLGSQGSVITNGNLLFSVNAGSNTLSMFTINPEDPWHPRLVGSPVSTLGEFPISVDYSDKLRKACVLNGGTNAGVSCFYVDQWRGLQSDGPMRVLTKSIINETTPPNGPPGSAAQVLFNPESTAVFVTVKGNAASTPAKLGSLAAWPIEQDGCMSHSAPAVTQISDIFMNFGFQFLTPSTIFMSDPAFGASLLEIGSDLKAKETAHTVLPGEKASCWTQYDPELDTLYAIDAGSNNLFTMNSKTGALTGSFAVKAPHIDSAMGLFDSSIKNGKMYSLAGANGLYVVDLAQKKTIQFLDLSSFGNRKFYQGMAVWP